MAELVHLSNRMVVEYTSKGDMVRMLVVDVGFLRNQGVLTHEETGTDPKMWKRRPLA